MTMVLNVLGIFVVIGVLYLLSYKKKKIDLRLIIKALIVQFAIAIIIVKIPVGRLVISKISDVVTGIIDSGQAGLDFVFGPLSSGSLGFVFAIHALGKIIFLSSLVSVLYYIGVLGFVVKGLGKIVGKLMGTTEVESFVAVANMFLGQTESPILVGKYIGRMTDSEIMLVLVSGMGSMSVSILGGYTAMGIPMEYLLIASAMVPIGSILVSKIILPQTENVEKIEDIKMDNKGNNSNIIEAASEGSIVGMQIAMAIGASLIAMVSFVFMINKVLGMTGISLEQVFSYIFAPFGYLMGLDSSYALLEGSLLGSKLVLNEFVAFQQLGQMLSTLDPRTAMIITISLCGFANFSSLGICLAGITILCPDKRSVLARLVFRAMLGGVAVSILSAMIVGLVMSF